LSAGFIIIFRGLVLKELVMKAYVGVTPLIVIVRGVSPSSSKIDGILYSFEDPRGTV